MADDDKELFDSAIGDSAPPVEEAPAKPAEGNDRPRDEHGRFAPKEQPPAEKPAELAKVELPAHDHSGEVERKPAHEIPPWRLREESEARRAAEERANQAAQQLAEIRQEMARLQQQTKPPVQVPDMFEDPNAFIGHQVGTVVDPIKQEVAQLREFYSRRAAISEYGAEKVTAAYNALDQGLKNRDPEAHAVYQRAMQSLDPFGDIVQWHQKQTVFSQIGADPNAWFEKQLEERLKDPTHQAKLIERIRGNAKPSERPVTQLPPSLNKATSSSVSDDDDDMGEAGLLRTALRR